MNFSNFLFRIRVSPGIGVQQITTFTNAMAAQRVEQNLIAVAQLTATSNKEKNFETCKSLIENARKAGAKMVFLPEAFDFIAESHTQSFELAEDLNGQLIKSYSNLAKASDTWISLGGFHNKTGSKMFNSHLLINSNGQLCGQYNKTHLFDVELLDKNIRLKESDYVERGSSITPPIETPIGKIGLGICYDLRFPEFSSSLVRQGAQILTYPSAFTVATGLAHWESLIRARAIETQCYVVAAAQTGMHNSKRSSFGHAMVVDPWGTVISQCQEGTGFSLATIDLNYLAKLRSEMPVLSHRRPDVYQLTIQPESNPLVDLPADEDTFQFGQVSIKGWGVFYRTRFSIAFVNKKCVVPGHVLVIPVREALRLSDLHPHEVADLFLAAQKVQRGMELLHQLSSSTLTVQDGPDAGQSISHVHIHILPRRPGDFSENDQVYRELQNHDKGTDVQWRSEEEMKEEALQLRHFFQTML